MEGGVMEGGTMEGGVMEGGVEFICAQIPALCECRQIYLNQMFSFHRQGC